MTVVRAKVVAAKIKARLAKKEESRYGAHLAVPSPLNVDSFTLRFVFTTFLIKRAVPRGR